MSYPQQSETGQQWQPPHLVSAAPSAALQSNEGLVNPTMGETVELGSHASEDEGDSRFTMGLIADAVALLDRHGYQRPNDEGGTRALGAAVGALYHLAETYEGR